jgi:hypothetical protein
MLPIALDMFLSIPDAESFAVAAREWLASVPGLLAPQEWAEVLRAGKPPFSGPPRLPFDDDWEEPFMAWGEIIVAPMEGGASRIWRRPATSQTLEWLAQVLAGRPASARIQVCRVDVHGFELPGAATAHAEAAYDQDGVIPVARLRAGDDLMWRAGARPEDADELRERLVSVARAWAGRPGVLGLFAGQDIARVGGTALMHSLVPVPRWYEAAVEGELQGYSWVTLVPAGAVARLGGAAALTGSGAFWRADELPTGGVLVQATERLGEYGLAAARRVFEVLAPALPAGLPRKRPTWPSDVPWLVIPEDAATRR